MRAWSAADCPLRGTRGARGVQPQAARVARRELDAAPAGLPDAVVTSDRELVKQLLTGDPRTRRHAIEAMLERFDLEPAGPPATPVRRGPTLAPGGCRHGVGRAEDCPACGAPLAAWRRAPDHEPASGRTHLLLRCAACGTARTAGPRRRRRGPRGGRLRAGRAARRRARPRRCCAPSTAAGWRCSGARAAGPLLDVGAGRGRFVAHARARGSRTRAGSSRRPRAARRTSSAVALRGRRRRSGLARRDHAVARPRARRGPRRRARSACTAGCARAATLLVGVARPRLAAGAPRRPALVPPRPAAPPHALHRRRAARAARARPASTSTATEHRLLEHNPFGLWQSAGEPRHARRRRGSTTCSSATPRCAPPTPSRPLLARSPRSLAAEAVAGARPRRDGGRDRAPGTRELHGRLRRLLQRPGPAAPARRDGGADAGRRRTSPGPTTRSSSPST